MTTQDKYGDVAGRIRSVRRKRGLTQAEMAQNLGVSQKTISRIEKGETQPDFSLLMAIHEKLDVSAQWLITGEEATPGLGRLADFFSEEALSRVLKAALREVSTEAGYDAAGATQLPLFDIEGGQTSVVYEGDLPVREAPLYVAAPPALDDPGAFACQLHGDSMTPEFVDGDILIFSPAAKVSTGDYACVRLADRSAFRLVFFLDDNIRLVALNRSHLEEQVHRGEAAGLFKLVWKMSKY
ncbi:MAG: helix-turn-helix transcriptional regulator [Planctomycetes bacterium]|nr:helix-turn-helix transcriptional regulator [Planctomycetota bacterium]